MKERTRTENNANFPNTRECLPILPNLAIAHLNYFMKLYPKQNKIPPNSSGLESLRFLKCEVPKEYHCQALIFI